MLPSSKCASRSAQPVGFCRAWLPSIRTCLPGANICALRPLRSSTLRDAISQCHTASWPFAVTRRYTNECGLMNWNSLTVPSSVTVFESS